ncbi:MAG: hypothetical protein ABH880_03330 [Patescibacteria group bacterium]
MAQATGKPKEHVKVEIGAAVPHLDADEMCALGCLAEATAHTNSIFLRQMRQDMEATGGIFDGSRGNNFYPEGMTREEIEAYLEDYPDERGAVMSPFTVVERDGDRLVAIPYSDYYANEYGRIASLLEHAEAFTGNESLRTFLASRTRAFRTNEYRASDIDWVRVTDSPFEIVIGPYEKYKDELFGVKRDVEGILGVVLPKETADAKVYQAQTVEFDAYLGQRYGYSAMTTLTPFVVVDQVISGGHPVYGYVPMALNLPNDPDIQQEVGSKKMFIRNVIEAKQRFMTEPIAERVLGSGFMDLLDPSIYLKKVVGHEASHGLSFGFDGEGFLGLGSPLEEAKADIFGLLFLYFLAERGIVEQDVPMRAIVTRMTDALRQLRMGLDEAHARGALTQYCWFLEHDALRFVNGRLEFKPELFKETLNGLGDKFYVLSRTKSRAAAQHFFDEWGQVPDELREIVGLLGDIPVDIDPVFTI